ncbi:MAG: hypothetical protein KDB79_08565, partial [Acidobacteria bacterium]|nr:hypothetical protein [Acidobacteriota bacterium]
LSSGQTATTKTPAPTTDRTPVKITDNNNISGVRNKPTSPTTFRARTSYMVTSIQTYHWNNGRGTSRPGTIALIHSNGKVYGPWRASGTPGQGGVPNAYWQVTPNAVIPAGTYTILDSDPATWSQNSQSGGKGFASVKGYAVSNTANPPVATNPPTTNKPNVAPERMRISVTYVNASRQAVHIFATGEKFSAENKLSPGGRRVVSGEGPKFTKITVYAGVNGKVIHQISFNVSPDGKYTVTFGSNNKLSLGQASATPKPPVTSGQNSLIYLSFINRSKSSMHIFAQSEKFSAANLLKPGQFRNVFVKYSGQQKLQIMAFTPAGKYDHSIEFLVKSNGSYTVTLGSNNKLSLTESSGALNVPNVNEVFSKTFINPFSDMFFMTAAR